MAESKVLYEGKFAPTPSLDKLFQGIEERDKEERAFSQTKELLGLKHGYEVAGAQEQNKLTQQLEEFKSNLGKTRALEANTALIQTLQSGAMGVAEGGIKMPEFVEEGGYDSMTGAPVRTPKTISPLTPPDALRDIYSTRLGAGLREQGAEAGEQRAERLAQEKIRLNAATPEMLKGAHDLAGQLKQLAGDDMADPSFIMGNAIQAAATEGVSKSDLMRYVQQGAASLSKSQSTLKMVKELEGLRGANAMTRVKYMKDMDLNIAKLKNDPSVNNLKNTDKLLQIVGREIDDLESTFRNLEFSMGNASSTAERQKIRAEQAATRTEVNRLKAKQDEIKQASTIALLKQAPDEPQKRALARGRTIYRQLFPKKTLSPTGTMQEFNAVLEALDEKEYKKFSDAFQKE